MPDVRPFRALRYESDVVRRPRGRGQPAVRRDRPDRSCRSPDIATRRTPSGSTCRVGEQGDGPDDRYRRAARTFAAWRSDGTFRKDPRPSLYVYEQLSAGTTASARAAVRRGFFGRLRLEPFGSGGAVAPREAPGPAQREDRYKLLRATGVNTSPIVVPPRGPDRPGGPDPGRGRARARRRSTSAMPAGFATGSGPWPPTDRTPRRSRPCSQSPARVRSRSPMARPATSPRCATVTSAG